MKVNLGVNQMCRWNLPTFYAKILQNSNATIIIRESYQLNKENLKIEITTPAEWAVILFIILSVIALFDSIKPMLSHARNIYDMIYFGGSVLSLLVFIKIAFNFSEFYIINFELGALVKRTLLFSMKKDKIIEKLIHIDAVVANTNCAKPRNGGDLIWSYRLEIVNFIGVVIPLGNWEDGFAKVNSKAKKFALLTGVNYVMGDPGMPFKPIKKGDRYTFAINNSRWK